MALGKRRRGVVLFFLFDQVIGGRGGIAQHQIAFAFQEQAVGFAPALGHGNGFLRQLLPGLRRVVAVDFLHPEQQAQTRRAGARVFIDHAPFLRAFHQLFQTGRWVFKARFVVDEGEVTVIEGHEGVILPAARQRQAMEINLAFGEQAGLLRRLQQVVVEAEHHVGLAVLAFHAHAVQQRDAIFQRHIAQLAAALRFKGFFHRRAGAPFGGEGVVGVDGQGRFCRQRRHGQQHQQRENLFNHFALLGRVVMSRKGSERSSLSNPYVGINRIRFDGFFSAFRRHPVENGSF